MLKHKIIVSLVTAVTILTSTGAVAHAAPNTDCPAGTLPAFAFYRQQQNDYMYVGAGLSRLSSFEVTVPTLVQEPDLYRQDILATANEGHLIQKSVVKTFNSDEVLIDENINMSTFESIFGYTGPGPKVDSVKLCVE